MRKTLCLGASVLAVALAAITPASAADMYRAPQGLDGYKDGPAYVPNTWTGFYIGINGGYGWNAGTVGNNIVDVESGISSDIVTNIPVNAPDPRGGFGGGQIGYNFQRDHIVFGVEADIQGAGIKDKTSSSFRGSQDLNPLTFASKYSLDYFGTVRARLGYAFDRTLVYATGGFAYGGVSYNTAASFQGGFGPAYNLKRDATDTGYVVGGGLERKLSPAWSVKAEYQYINLGTDSASGVYFCCSEFNNTVKFDNAFHTLRVGLNYHVGQTYEPLK
jgi:outer membrane immunogenic protein